LAAIAECKLLKFSSQYVAFRQFPLSNNAVIGPQFRTRLSVIAKLGLWHYFYLPANLATGKIRGVNIYVCITRCEHPKEIN
jgi:hypothetical protein